MFMNLKFRVGSRGWPVGLVAWFSLRVREVPGSTPGQAPFSRSYFSFFFFVCLFICFAFCFRLASNAFPDIGSVARIEKKKTKKIARRTTLKIHKYHMRTGRGGDGGCSPPKILGNSEFLGSRRKFGQSRFLKTSPCFYYYFEEINTFYFNLKSA